MALALGFLASGCDNGGGSNNSSSGNLTDAKTSNYNTQSCLYSANEGGGVNLSKVETKEYVTTSFDKQFNKVHFDEISQASVNNTLAYMGSNGVQIYKGGAIKTSLCSAPLFGNLPAASGKAKEIWEPQAIKADREDRILLGIYLEGSELSPQNNNQSPVIVVRDNTNRRTLVHEYMHHLYTMRANEMGISPRIAKNELNDQFEKFDKLTKNGLSDKQNFKEVVSLFSEIVKNFDLVMIGFPLEEVTIEKWMLEADRNRSLRFVPEGNANYLIDSSLEAHKSYRSIKSYAQELSNIAYKLDDKESLQTLKSLENLFSKRISEIEKIQSKYITYTTSVASKAFMDSTDTHQGCSRSHEADEIINKIENLDFSNFN